MLKRSDYSSHPESPDRIPDILERIGMDYNHRDSRNRAKHSNLATYGLGTIFHEILSLKEPT